MKSKFEFKIIASLLLVVTLMYSCQKDHLDDVQSQTGLSSDTHCTTDLPLPVNANESGKTTASKSYIIPVILIPKGSTISRTEKLRIRECVEMMRLWYQRELVYKDLRWGKIKYLKGDKTGQYYRNNNKVWSELPGEMKRKFGWSPWDANTSTNRIALVMGVDLGGWAGGAGFADGRGLAILGTDGIFGRGSTLGQWFCTPEFFVGTAIHELGHALTLGHTTNQSSIMCFHGDFKNKHLISSEKTQVRSLPSIIPGIGKPMARWTFDKSGQNPFVDESGYNNSLSHNSGVTHGYGLYERSANFNGYNGVALTANGRCNASSGISISVWLRPDNIYKNGNIVSKWYAKDSYALAIRNGRYYFSIALPGGTWGKMYTISAPAYKKWSHVFASYNGSKMLLYVDGKLLAQKSVSGSLQQSTRPVAIGNHPSGNGFDGNIDAVTLFNKGIPADRLFRY